MAPTHDSNIEPGEVREAGPLRVSRLPRLRPSEWLLAGYFLYTAPMSVLAGASPEDAARRLALALSAICALAALASLDAGARSRFISIVRDWLPAPGMLAAYWAVDWSAASPGAHRLERSWIVWDRLLLNDWGVKAAVESLGPVVPTLLECSYSLLYAIPPVSIGVLYLYGRRNRVDRFLFALLLPTLVSYALLPRFPSEGPRLLFRGEDLPAYTSAFRALNLWLLDSFDIRASVFPSGHVTVAFAAAIAMWSVLPERRWVGGVLAALAAAIAAATVYGRYHYAVDAAAGMAIAAVMGCASLPLHNWMAGRRPGSRAG